MSHPYQVMPPLSDDQYRALKSSIEAEGVKIPVELDENGAILDGHHRVQICAQLGIKNYPVLVRPGLSEDEKRAHARSVNLNRRHLNRRERDKLISAQIKDTPSLSDRAIAARFGVDHKTVGNKRKRMVSNGEIPHVKTMIDTLGRKRKRNPAPTYIDNTPEGRSASVARAKEIRTENMEASRATRLGNLKKIAAKGEAKGNKMPVAAFPVLYVDNPWKNQVWGEETGNDRSPPYPTMSVDELCELCAGDKSPATKDAVMYFWRKANNVEEALRVVHAWGFNVVSEMIWDKVRIGTGRWVRDRHEVLMICTRGDIVAPEMGSQPASVFCEKRGEHSRKPVWFAEQITKLYPDVPKLELFQRRQSLTKGDVRLKRNSGWKFWGNESGGE